MLTWRPDDCSAKSLERPCPVCGSSTGHVLHHQRFAAYDQSPLPTKYDVVACPDCGFAFADTPAPQAAYDRYYRDYSKYESEEVSSGSGLGAWEVARFRRTAADIARLRPEQRAALLDVGCAGGGLLAELERLGYRNLCGVDHAPACVEAVSGRGFGAYQGGIGELPAALAKKRFDALLLSHVLEHLRDLRRALRHCAALLDEGGLLYLETPDAARYAELSIVPYYCFDCEHINHFSLGSLRNLAEQHGFTFVEGGTKTFMASSTMPYPAVWAAFRRDASAAPRTPTYDASSRDGLLAHLRESRRLLARPEVEALARSGEPVIVWGAGSYAQRLLENSPLGCCNICYFVDNDQRKRGKVLAGVEIRTPAEIDRRAPPILICAALFSRDIRQQIESMGLTNPVHELCPPCPTTTSRPC